MRVDLREGAAQPPVGVAQLALEVGAEQRVTAGEAGQTAGDDDAQRREAVEPERPAGRAADREARGAPRRREVGHLVGVDVELADVVQPREDVATAVAARHARVAADGEHDVAAGAAQLGGELLPRRPGADDEHAAVRQLLGAAVARGVQLASNGGAAAAAAGMRGTSQSPVAITTLAACQSPRSVATW